MWNNFEGTHNAEYFVLSGILLFYETMVYEVVELDASYDNVKRKICNYVEQNVVWLFKYLLTSSGILVYTCTPSFLINFL